MRLVISLVWGLFPPRFRELLLSDSLMGSKFRDNHFRVEFDSESQDLARIVSLGEKFEMGLI
jgi:hypothetical protein